MSSETMEHLNTQVLVGDTDQRGKAWHYRLALQGDESNHYPGHIPVDDVHRRLLNWTAVERPVLVRVPHDDLMSADGIDENGQPYRLAEIPDRKAVVASDNGHVFGIFSQSYAIHQFGTWLVENVATIIGGDLGISSAGLLQNRGIAWVEVSVPETITTPHGIEFRPNLLACTSHTGKLATTYKRTITNTVCDNTMAMALSERGQTFKVKHSRLSLGRIESVREALAMVHQVADEFAAGAAALVEQKVSPLQFKTVIETLVPITDDTSKSGETIALKKRGELATLYLTDPRVAPWAGTAYGVVQAFNTWNHHFQGVRGAGSNPSEAAQNALRAERNMLNTLTGETDKADAQVLAVLAGV